MEGDDEVSYTTSNDTMNALLEEQDVIIDNLREEIETLKLSIKNFMFIIQSKLHDHLMEIMEFL